MTWLTLGLSLALSGCAEVHKSPGLPPEPIPEPVAEGPANTTPQSPFIDKSCSAEAENRGSEAVEPNRPQEDIVEPNGPAASETADGAALVAQPPDPNQALVEEPSGEPNETSAVEASGPQPAAPDLPPDPSAAFYQEYGELLDQYVLADGRVDYDSLRRKRLWIKQLLRTPDELDPNVYRAWSESEQLAFWINTYNLKMLDVIVRNHPIESSWWLRLTWPPSDIRHIEGIWSDYRFIVMDEEFTLGEVERRFFHRTFADPRAFLAISYASRSGPRFRRQPYRGEELDRQLDEQVRTFLVAQQGFRIDRDKQVVYLSALFKPTWRGKEFVARYGTDKKFKDRAPETRAVLSFLTRYVSDDDVYFLEVENYAIEYTNFDWRLNDASRRP